MQSTVRFSKYVVMWMILKAVALGYNKFYN